MKNISFKLVLVAILALFSISCSKPVDVKFQFTQDNSQEGKVSFVYTGDPGSSYFWDFGDGESSSDRSPVHFYRSNGTYYPKVVVKSGNNSNSSSATIVVSNVKGTHGFYVRKNIGQYVAVYVDGSYIGSVTKFITSGQPLCESSGFAWGRFSEGTHRVEAIKADGSKLISGTFKVFSGQCSAAQLD